MKNYGWHELKISMQISTFIILVFFRNSICEKIFIYIHEKIIEELFAATTTAASNVSNANFMIFCKSLVCECE